MSDNPVNAVDVLTDGPPDADWTLVLAHGAGQGIESPFMARMADTLGRAGIRVIRFEFPDMAQIRRTGRRTPPNREPVLLERWNRIIDDHELAAGTDARRLLIGGKSLGGRMASLIADARGAAGLSAWATHSIRRESRIGRARSICAACARQRSSLRAPAIPSARPARLPAMRSRHRSVWPGSKTGTTASSRAGNPDAPGSRTWRRRQKPFSTSSLRCEIGPWDGSRSIRRVSSLS